MFAAHGLWDISLYLSLWQVPEVGGGGSSDADELLNSFFYTMNLRPFHAVSSFSRMCLSRPSRLASIRNRRLWYSERASSNRKYVSRHGSFAISRPRSASIVMHGSTHTLARLLLLYSIRNHLSLSTPHARRKAHHFHPHATRPAIHHGQADGLASAQLRRGRRVACSDRGCSREPRLISTISAQTTSPAQAWSVTVPNPTSHYYPERHTWQRAAPPSSGSGA
jgi:hypothetical protein